MKFIPKNILEAHIFAWKQAHFELSSEDLLAPYLPSGFHKETFRSKYVEFGASVHGLSFYRFHNDVGCGLKSSDNSSVPQLAISSHNDYITEFFFRKVQKSASHTLFLIIYDRIHVNRLFILFTL